MPPGSNWADQQESMQEKKRRAATLARQDVSIGEAAPASAAVRTLLRASRALVFHPPPVPPSTLRFGSSHSEWAGQLLVVEAYPVSGIGYRVAAHSPRDFPMFFGLVLHM